MKKILSTIMALVILMLLLSAAYAANGGASLYGTASSMTLAPGDEVTISVALENAAEAKSVSLVFDYDNTGVFENPAKGDGRWLLSNTTIAAFDTSKVPCGTAAAAYGEATNINGSLFNLKLRVRENAVFGKSTITVVPIIRNGAQTVACESMSLALTIVDPSAQSDEKWDLSFQVPGTGMEGTEFALKSGTTELKPDADNLFRQIDGGNYTLCVSRDGFVSYTKEVDIDKNTVVNIPRLVKRGNVNGASDYLGQETGVEDMACLYTYLSKGFNEGQISDGDYFRAVADVNEDGWVNILDYQALYVEIQTAHSEG